MLATGQWSAAALRYISFSARSSLFSVGRSPVKKIYNFPNLHLPLSGGKILYYMWAQDSMEANSLMPFKDYLLPSGGTALSPCYQYQSLPPPVCGVFGCVDIVNLAGDMWCVEKSKNDYYSREATFATDSVDLFRIL